MPTDPPIDTRISRRALLVAGPAWLGASPSRAQTASAPETLAFLGFEIQDEQPDAARLADHARRLAAITAQMREGLERLGLYRVVDLSAAQAAIAEARGQSEYLYRCNGCLSPVGEAAGARYVGLGWVQRVSNLILNINLEFRETRGDRMVLTKSVDIRGDNDESWRRGVGYMLRDMAERRQRQPRYGL